MILVGSSALSVERSVYVANIISGILYGILVYMVFRSYNHLKGFRRETLGRRQFYIIYGFVQLLLVTIEFSLNAYTGQLMWIEHRSSPGGPYAYYISMSSSWYRIFVISCTVVSMGMADGLMLYRCYIIWSSNHRVIILPLLLYIAEISIGIAVPIEVARSHTTFLSKPSTNFSIPWVSLQCSLTALLTALIVGRIFYVSRSIKLDARYTGIVAMLVEPAFLLSLSGIAFAVCVGRKSYLTVPFAHIWGMLVAIAPQSIILRVATGRAWTKNTVTNATQPINFGPHDNAMSSLKTQRNDHPVIHIKSDLETSVDSYEP